MELRNLIGLPFEEDGQDAKGINCWGLCRMARRVLEGKDDLPSYLGKYKVPLRYRELERLIVAERDLNWKRIPKGQEQAGDFMLIIRRGFTTHVGYVTKPGWVLHIEAGINSVHLRYPNMQADLPESKIEGFYRYG